MVRGEQEKKIPRGRIFTLQQEGNEGKVDHYGSSRYKFLTPKKGTDAFVSAGGSM